MVHETLSLSGPGIDFSISILDQVEENVPPSGGDFVTVEGPLTIEGENQGDINPPISSVDQLPESSQTPSMVQVGTSPAQNEIDQSEDDKKNFLSEFGLLLINPFNWFWKWGNNSNLRGDEEIPMGPIVNLDPNSDNSND